MFYKNSSDKNGSNSLYNDFFAQDGVCGESGNCDECNKIMENSDTNKKINTIINETKKYDKENTYKGERYILNLL